MKSKFTGLAVALVMGSILTLLCLATVAGASPPARPRAENHAALGPAQVHPVWTDFNISDKAGSQLYPAVAADSDLGSFLAVWQEGISPYGVSAKIVTWAGETAGEKVFLDTTSNNETWPDVAFDSVLGNQYMVVWDAGPSQYPEIYGQLANSAGDPILGTIRIDDDDDHNDFHPAIAHDSVDGPFLVVWSERRSDVPGGEAQISGRLLDGTGIPLTGVFKVGDLDDYDQSHPAVAYNSADKQYLVVWDESPGEGDLTGQIVSNMGTPVGTSFAVSAYAQGGYAFPDVAYDSRLNEYLVVWYDMVTGDYNIYGQVVSAMGALVGNRLEICTAPGDQQHPAVDYNGRNGVYLVTWDDQRSSGNDDIYGQWVKGGNPALIGDNVPIVEQDRSQTYPALAYNGQPGQFLTTWQDTRDTDTSPDVYGQRLTGLPYDVGVFPLSLWSQPAVICEDSIVAVGAHIFNRFGPALDNVDVHFYQGDPDAGGTLIGSQTVNLARGDVLTPVAVTWDTTGLTGTQTLYVVVDPDDEVTEMLEGNNVFSRTRDIWPSATCTQPPTCTLTIDGGAQATHDAQVNLIIDAHDQGGSGVHWMYLREWWASPYAPDLGTVIPDGTHGNWSYRDSGWLRYDPLYATTGYSYTMLDTPGIKYIQVWCRNGAGTVSDPPLAWDDINLVSQHAWTLADAEWHLYRMQWSLDASVAVTVTTTEGDADLFVWPPGITGTTDLFSNNPGTGMDPVSFTAVTGTYQIVAYGSAPADSQYTIEWQADGEGFPLYAPSASILTASKELPAAPPMAPDATPPGISAVPEFRHYLYLPLIMYDY